MLHWTSIALAALALVMASPRPTSVTRAQTPATPIALHPENPHYFQWRGRPTMLITSGEHYGAVMNLDFDYRKYLDTLAADGLNYTRVFSGAYVEPQGAFNIARNTMAPGPGRFLAPWARSAQPGYAGGGNKFDLTAWNADYFKRLTDFLTYAASKGIVVELTLFCPMYEEVQWSLSPMNASNNVNGVGSIGRNDVYTMDKNGGLLTVQETLVRKLVTDLNGFDNLFFEICNEPYFGGVTMAWQHHVADIIVDTERKLPAKHLIAQNIANNSATIEKPHPAVSIFNFHYASPPDTVRMNYALNKVIGDDETGFAGTSDVTYRGEAWDFVIAGGALFNNLDYSFVAGQEDGTFVYPQSQPGGGSVALRRQLKILREFVAGFDFIRMTPDDSVIVGGAPAGGSARALVERGRAMAIYVRKTIATSAWSARWTGALQAPASGEYAFHTVSNDGVRLWINDRQVIDDWTDHGEKEDTGRMTLRAGETYRVRLEFFYNGGQGVTRLRWTPPGGTKETIPTSALRPEKGSGNGLRGEYFKGTALKQPWTERVDAQVDFSWGTRPPVAIASSGATSLQVAIPDGTWQAEWVDPTTGTISKREQVTSGGARTLASPDYADDIALRLRRTGS